MLKALGVFAAIFLGCFLLLWLPFAIIREHSINQRAVVAATASDHRIHQRQRPGLRPLDVVVATLTFARPEGAGSIDCRLENYEMGRPSDPEAYAPGIDIAVHPHSCYEPERLPLKTLRDYFVTSASILFVVIGLCILHAFVEIGTWTLIWEAARGRRRRRPDATGAG